jgi:hypothetical protein
LPPVAAAAAVVAAAAAPDAAFVAASPARTAREALAAVRLVGKRGGVGR